MGRDIPTQANTHHTKNKQGFGCRNEADLTRLSAPHATRLAIFLLPPRRRCPLASRTSLLASRLPPHAHMSSITLFLPKLEFALGEVIQGRIQARCRPLVSSSALPLTCALLVGRSYARASRSSVACASTCVASRPHRSPTWVRRVARACTAPLDSDRWHRQRNTPTTERLRKARRERACKCRRKRTPPPKPLMRPTSVRMAVPTFSPARCWRPPDRARGAQSSTTSRTSGAIPWARRTSSSCCPAPTSIPSSSSCSTARSRRSTSPVAARSSTRLRVRLVAAATAAARSFRPLIRAAAA